MSPHILDNPAWNALTSGNKDLALGTDEVKFFPEDVSPFAGLKQFNEKAFYELFNLISNDRTIIVPSIHKLQIPVYWKIIKEVVALQMIYNSSEVITKIDPRIVSLAEKDIPQMIALTELTEPGPFLQRTIDFGCYKGIFSSGELVAMAGRRMHPYNYIEISAVCTHPDYTGKGYARSLMNDQIRKIANEGNIPFLHVRDDNKHAIELYKRIGFTVRAEMNIYVLQKED